MPFIGKQPEVGAYSKLDAITTSATATYNLTLGGGAYYPSSANHLLVSLNGVMQAPQDSFTVSGSTIVFDSALTSSDNIDFIMALGDVLDIGTPSDGTVTSAKLAGPLTTPSSLTVTGKLGIGVASPTGKVHIKNDSAVATNTQTAYNNASLRLDNLNTSSSVGLSFGLLGANTNYIQGGYNEGTVAPIALNPYGGGVAIGGTAAANTMDEYEEGTFTPIYDNVAQPTYQAQTGKYIKIGKLVHVTGTITCTGLDTSDGSAVIITGFPFQIDTANEAMNFNLGRYSSQLNGEEIDLVNIRATSTGAMFLRSSNNSLAYNSGINANGTLQFAATYHATS